MPPNITLELVDGVRVVVPDSLGLITPYVLQEQKDWFEDEIRFLRRLIRPGQKVLDIGANCGVYTLTLAKLVGPTGCVWAFEPASSTANLLAAGIAANNFTHVELIRSALSSAPGTAQLSINENSELNELVRGAQPTGATETVSCVTLDASMAKYGWKDIDLVKIDAEGEETNILRAGTRFLEAESPLIEYEIKAVANLNMDLVEHFAALGYQSYRLVPGLDLLVPFDRDAPVDGFLLNLFCCKPDRAARLAGQGFLLHANTDMSAAELPDSHMAFDSSDPRGWRTALVGLPYGAMLADEWSRQMSSPESQSVEEPLFHYALSRDTSLRKGERFAALEASYQGFMRVCGGRPPSLRLSSLARVALDYGTRSVAVSALDGLCNMIFKQVGQVSTSEPFLAPGARFDSISPGSRQAVLGWITAAAFEELERNQHFSSYFTGKGALRRLEMIRDLGFGSEEMKRRLALVQRRFGT